ncbi:MAG: hypothetical protein WB791_06935 [Waddliaceae bacterium]
MKWIFGLFSLFWMLPSQELDAIYCQYGKIQEGKRRKDSHFFVQDPRFYKTELISAT